MSKVLLTGAAGFIGSHLCENLVEKGFDVIGIDCFTDFYPSRIKRRNIRELVQKKNFILLEKDILELDNIDDGIEFIFHTAAQPGVRTSWGKEFEIYVKNNIQATQHLLELSRTLGKLKKFVYSSSSSVYGDVSEFPTPEKVLPRPKSPYGVTKLAGENLCNLYYTNFGIPVVSLRYFTVFGPRQRPDMAFHKFIEEGLSEREVVVYGDGKQSRDFTYVSDVVEANIKASKFGSDGEVYNIGGGNHSSINQVIDRLRELTGKPLKVRYVEEIKGDVRSTRADMKKTTRMINFTPQVSLDDGLKEEILWIKELYNFS